MESQEKTKATREPLGNLCVIREESLNGWAVKICTGVSGRQSELGRFSTRGEAEAFAEAQLPMIQKKDGRRYILHVDDCPCWQKEM